MDDRIALIPARPNQARLDASVIEEQQAFLGFQLLRAPRRAMVRSPRAADLFADGRSAA